ncbi:DUF3488 and transglutaminase-like domain-containing protein [Actinomadura macrotermitis]|uniref:Transglutaminase-like domain-containing protein n=1 Tax=Actinomadura macrotermitis TaxID=2585200 RepID=A0A7K0BME4_9ACTN|nr:DUF3488 and transglutaminase-like domain-containing protein [Actinomadura macrotermitis]MQY02331.1 hypothetical protein [Actinomadura macrotermitis]
MRIRITVMAALATLAGSAGLYPLFSGRAWFWSGFGAVLAVAAGGLLVRRFRLPAVVNALGGLAALLLYLTLVYGRGEALLGVVPTPGSLHRLGELAGDGWQAANRYAAPVPLTRGIRLLAAAGIGLVAVIVDLLAVRLRRAAPAGLPLLAMYSVPAAVRQDSVNWLVFGAGAAAYLALLMADARDQVGGWGRVVFTPRWSEEVPMAGAAPRAASGDRTRPDSSGLSASGRRIGLGAVAIALLLPSAVPGVQPRGMFGLGGGRGGSQTVTTPDPLVSLKRQLTRQDDAVVLTYRTDDPAPDYLRLYALDKFDDDRWTFNRMQSSGKDQLTGDPLPAPPGLSTAASRRVTTRIAVRPQVARMDFLPVPYAPARVTIKGDWRVHPPSLMIYSLKGSAAGRSYTVQSVRAAPTAAQLEASGAYPGDIVARYTAVPHNVPTAVRDLAVKITEGATTAHAQAVALQRWFTVTGGFRYDLSAPPPRHGSDLADFLLHSKRGYCEQFAAAMALMARLLGIPARVGLGYTAGTRSGTGEWTVRSRDSHAWPELYFEGAGWVRFEPTPSGAGGQGTASSPPYTVPEEDARPERGGRTTPSTEPTAPNPQGGATGDTPNHRKEDKTDKLAPAERPEEDGGLPVAWLTGGVLVALLLLAPMAARMLTRRRRWAAAAPPDPARTGRPRPGGGRPAGPAGAGGGAAHAAWREMRADALDHGLTWRPSDTPRAAARRLTETLRLDEEAAGALGRIARAEEQARYAQAATPPSAEGLRADVRTVREAFAAGVTRRARWRARVLPPSTVTAGSAAARTAGERITDAVGRLSTMAEQATERFRRDRD